MLFFFENGTLSVGAGVVRHRMGNEVKHVLCICIVACELSMSLVLLSAKLTLPSSFSFCFFGLPLLTIFLCFITKRGREAGLLSFH